MLFFPARHVTVETIPQDALQPISNARQSIGPTIET